MKIITPTFEILNYTPDMAKTIEIGGRTCYASCDKITEDSYEDIIPKWMNMKHNSVLEHSAITVKFVTDRGVMAELTRHRMASFSVQSTRYCNYSKDKYNNEITVLEPYFFTGLNEDGLYNNKYKMWKASCEQAESAYIELNKNGASAQEARSVLPNSLATEIVMTANPREWRHVIELRTHRDAHPQIRQIICPMAKVFAEKWSVLFGDIGNLDHSHTALEVNV